MARDAAELGLPVHLVRDASFSNYVFRRIGDPSDADVFLAWVLTNVERDGRPHVMYALDGSQPPDERQDPQLRGYRGSAPVRWGNAARRQLQHDVYGEIIDIGGEGAFLLCSFWLVDNLAGQERVDEAHELYESLCSRANPLGLLPEQIHPDTGEFLGNFPQAFSHVGVLASGLRLLKAERRAAHAGPASGT